MTEKDEYQLIFLPPDERRLARAARDDVRELIAARDPLFDPRGPYYALPEGAATLPPSTTTMEVR